MARTIRSTDYTGYGSKDSKTDRKADRKANRAKVNAALNLMARDLGISVIRDGHTLALADAMALPRERGTEGRLSH